jgi:hypothetical protein
MPFLWQMLYDSHLLWPNNYLIHGHCIEYCCPPSCRRCSHIEFGPMVALLPLNQHSIYCINEPENLHYSVNTYATCMPRLYRDPFSPFSAQWRRNNQWKTEGENCKVCCVNDFHGSALGGNCIHFGEAGRHSGSALIREGHTVSLKQAWWGREMSSNQ